MKKFLNSPDCLVDESLAGFVGAYAASVRSDPQQRVCLDADPPVAGKVALSPAAAPGTSRFMQVSSAQECSMPAASTGFSPPDGRPGVRRSQSCRRGRRSPVHRQELHRRRHQVPLRGRARAGPGDRWVVVLVDDDAATSPGAAAVGRRGIGHQVRPRRHSW